MPSPETAASGNADQQIAELLRSGCRLRHENRILTLLAGDAPLEQVLKCIVAAVEAEDPLAVCQISQLDAPDTLLTQRAVPTVSELFPASSEGVVLGEAANAAGSWSEPIQAAGGRVLGAVAIYHRARSSPQREDLKRLQWAAGFALRAIERKQTQAALAGSRATFESLARVSPVGILLFDAAGKCVEVNRRWCEMSGLTAQQAEGNGWSEAVHPLDRASVLARWKSSVKAQQAFFSEHRLRPRDGYTTWVVCQTEPIVDALNRLTGYVRTLTDVSRQKQTEQSLRLLSGMLAAKSGAAFFEAVCLQLAQILDVDGVAVCTHAQHSPDRYTTLAQVWDGQVQPNMTFPAAGTPCADVAIQHGCIVPRNVQQLYPDDAYFAEQQIESYAGVPLVDSRGRQIGHMSVLSCRVLHDPVHVESVMSLFAVSVAAEMQRQELTRNYADLFELSPDAIVLVDQKGTIVKANSQVEKLFGWKRDELVGHSVNVLVPVKEQAEHLELRQQHLAFASQRTTGEAPPNLRGVRRLRRDGSEVFVDVVLCPMETVHGTLIAAAVRDVSERQNMLNELHQAKAFADTVIESVSGLFYVLSHEGKFIRWNAATQTLLGLSGEAMRQTHALEVIHADDREMVGSKIAEAFRTGQAETETRLLTKDGIIHSLLNGRRMEIDGAVYLVGSGADITDRKQAEQEIHQLSQTLEQRVQARTAELRAANADIEKLAIVATHCQHGVVIADAEGRTEWVNEAFEQLTEFSSAEVVGRKAGVLLHGPRTDAAALQTIRQGLAARESIAVELINYTKSGRAFWNSLKISPVYNSDGQLVRFVGTQTDVTDRKRAERSLRRARQAAERASQAKSEFLATMSHELRTPLNGILGMNELLLRTELNTRQRQFATACSASGKLLVELINDVLDLSKIEAGKLELDPCQCRIEELIYSVVEILSPTAEQKGLTLTCALEPDVCVIGVCDDSRVRQVLVNLVANAIKFTSSGGVSISGRRVTRPDGETRLHIAVADTGIGILAERRDRLFKSFSQIDSSTTRRFGGTGLGLSICKQLIGLMAGEIGVESQVGVGSTFWLEIPLQVISEVGPAPPSESLSAHPPAPRKRAVQGQPPASAASASNASAASNASPLAGHILVAEDNEINQLYIVELLKYLNCTCDVVANGEEALASVARRAYDLMLMDCQMPEMDGFVATRELRRMEAAGELPGRLPIVALTANALKGDRERCLEAGMDDYIRKPVENDQLQKVLQKYLSESSLGIRTRRERAL